MATETVKHKAPWTLSQTLSWVIPYLIIGLIWILWFTKAFDFTAAIVCSVLLFIMGTFFLVSNRRLKNNSGLTAVMDNDDAYTLQVFQTKPRDYWNGKLDAKRNKAKLREVRSISFNYTENIPYVHLGVVDPDGNSQALIIPFRILIQDKVRVYVAQGLDGMSPKFRNEEEEAAFIHLLSEGKLPEAEPEEISQPSEK